MNTMADQDMATHLEYKLPKFRLQLVRENSVMPTKLHNCDNLKEFTDPMRHYSEEYFIMFPLNAQNEIIGYHEISHGTLSASLVHPREVFKAAMAHNAYGILVAHNHPGGSLRPSKDDIEITKILIEASKLLWIPLLDHVIVTYNGLYSFKEDMPELW